MELKPIRTKKDYQAALAQAERLWDAPAKSPEADRLDMVFSVSRPTPAIPGPQRCPTPC